MSKMLDFRLAALDAWASARQVVLVHLAKKTRKRLVKRIKRGEVKLPPTWQLVGDTIYAPYNQYFYVAIAPDGVWLSHTTGRYDHIDPVEEGFYRDLWIKINQMRGFRKT